MTISAKEAQHDLPKLLAEAAHGKDVQIATADGTLFRLVVVRKTDTNGTATDPENPPLAALQGAGGGHSFSSVEEVEAYLRKLRDEWD